jgi:multidrug transporter EmrE-like cation transporter
VKQFIVGGRQSAQHSLMKVDLSIWSAVLLCAGMFILCDGLSAHWGKTGNGRSLAIVMLLSPLSYSAFAFINTKMNLAMTGALVNTIVVVGAVLVGVIVFKEELSAMQYLGIVLAVASVTLLNLA